ncbi:MAG: MBL fold metallo-hydrolase [Acidobacteria bacterium]|jgi:cyclase|nr:MBL fold metallo-hydrolase [Acidobacteriota bacterium]
MKYVRLLLSIAALLGVALPAGAGEPQYFTLHDLGNGVYAAVGKPGSGAGSNSGFVIGDDGVAVIDTFQKPAAAEELLATIRGLTQQPVRFVVNTHYHIDHVAGNGVYHDAGAVLVAQKNVRAWERTENLKFWGDNIPPKVKAMVESLVLPDLVYDGSIDLYLGSRKLEVRTLPGHTGSDSIVVVPDANIVFCGDLFWNHTLPNTIDAHVGDWVVSDDRLITEHPLATFVPGHGEVGRAADVRALRDYLDTLRTDVARARTAGKEGTELVSTVEAELKPTYSGWGWYSHFIKRNISQEAAELAGTKRFPGDPWKK